MIKTVFVGIWVCAVTLGAGYVGTVWEFGAKSDEKKTPATALVKIKPMNIPIIRDGGMAGYMLLQFSVVADAEELKKNEVKPDAFFVDAVYKAIYARPDLDMTKLSGDDWTTLAKTAKDSVNATYGFNFLHNVLLDEFAFIPSGAARKDTKPVKKEGKKEGKSGHH